MTTPEAADVKKVLLAAPRGYCAGVDRAVETVERALEKYGAPVYVRKEIVHNRYVVDTLAERGAIFVDETTEVPEGSHLVFSAHGVSPAVHAEAKALSLETLDATCPLVTKVHNEVKRFARDGYQILLIGHEGHEEVEGTAGEAPDVVRLVDGAASVDSLDFGPEDKLVWLSQTTLSVDETMEIVQLLKAKFPHITDPPSDDICYALLDLEDAVELDLLSDAEIESVLSELTFEESTWHAQSSRQRCAMLRGIAIGKAIEDVAQTFMMHQSDLLNGNFKGKDLLALCSPQVQNTLEKAKELARTRIFRHRTKLMTEIATFPCLGSILDLLVPAAYAMIAEKQVDVRQSLALELLKNHDPIQETDSLYRAYMKILDFVGGMTDNAAAKMAQDLSGVGILR